MSVGHISGQVTSQVTFRVLAENKLNLRLEKILTRIFI